MIQAAGENLHDDFTRRGLRIGQVAKLELPGFAMRDKLDGLHREDSIGTRNHR
jgi:hypothetical protein